MPARPRQERLADREHITVIVRLVFDRRGKLIHGEALHARMGGGEPLAPVRFDRWRRLSWAIRDCLGGADRRAGE